MGFYGGFRRCRISFIFHVDKIHNMYYHIGTMKGGENAAKGDKTMKKIILNLTPALDLGAWKNADGSAEILGYGGKTIYKIAAEEIKAIANMGADEILLHTSPMKYYAVRRAAEALETALTTPARDMSDVYYDNGRWYKTVYLSLRRKGEEIGRRFIGAAALNEYEVAEMKAAGYIG